MRIHPKRAGRPVCLLPETIIQFPMVRPNASNERCRIGKRPCVLGEKSAKKLFAASLAPPREPRAVPGKVFVRLSIYPAGVCAENKAMVATLHAVDGAAAGGVGRDIELVERRRLRGSARIHGTKG